MLTSAEPTWRWVPDGTFSSRGECWDLMRGSTPIGWIRQCKSTTWVGRLLATGTECEVSSLQTAAGWLLAQAGAEVGK